MILARFNGAVATLLVLIAVPVWGGGPEAFKAGMMAEEMGDLNQAIELYTQAINSEDLPRKELAYYARGLTWVKKGNQERALADFSKAIDLNPYYAPIYRDRGNVWMEEGNPDRALLDYDKAIELDPTDASAYFNRGRFYLKKGDYDLAITDSKKAVELNPKDSEAYCNIGTAWLMKKSYNRAISNFTEAILLNPNYADAYFNRCIAHARNNQSKEALRDARHFIEIAPNHPRAPAMVEIVRKSELNKKSVFWSSVLGGFRILGHWQVWVALIAYAILNWVWLIGLGLLAGDDESGGRMAFGCITHTIGGTIFQAVLISLMVFYLAPIMLGAAKAMPLKFFSEFAWPVAKAGIIATVAVLILSFIPLIGGFIANTPGLGEFIEGVIIFRIFSANFIESFLKKTEISTDIYPGFWYSTGYFIVALVIAYGGLLLVASIKTLASRNSYGDDDGFMLALAPAIVRLLSLLPLFMYAQYTSQTIQRLTSF